MTPAGAAAHKNPARLKERSGAGGEAGSEGVSAVGNLMLRARKIRPETPVSPLGVKSHHVLLWCHRLEKWMRPNVRRR